MEKVPKEHELLQSTQAELEAETEEMFQVSNRLNDNFVRALKLLWRQLFIIWAVVIILFIGSFFVLREVWLTPPAAGGKPTPVTQPGSVSEVAGARQAPAASFTPEGEKVQGVLRQVGEAHLNKDIERFLAAYSPTFPDLEDKKARILKTWERYNYLDLRFKVENVAKPKADSLRAEVVWAVTLEDRRSREKTNLVKRYTVSLVHESGKWLIQDLVQEKTPRLTVTMNK
jgi:hypothetical protein